MDPNLQVSRDASRALEEFSEEFKGALALADFPLWAEQLGFVRRTDALKTTFPIPVSAAGYHEFKGDMKYRSLYHRSMSMTSKTWQDGVEEFARVIEAPDFIDWAGEPARMAKEWSRLPNEMVADMLAISSLAGPLLDFYRDADSNTASTRRLFATDHPFNVFNTGLGDFDNTLQCTAAEILSGAVFDDLEDHFSAILGANGKPMGLSIVGGTCLVPSTRSTLFKRALTDDLIIQAVNTSGVSPASSSVVAAGVLPNRHKGTISYVRANELADQDHFYALASGADGNHPWVVQQGSAPEEFLHDKSSERYKSTLKVAVSYVGQANAAACLPHRIVRVEITG